MRIRIGRSLAASGLLVLMAGTARADVDFRSLGPGGSYDAGSLRAVAAAGPSSGDSDATAAECITARSGDLSCLVIALKSAGSEPGDTLVSLCDDVGGPSGKTPGLLAATDVPGSRSATGSEALISVARPFPSTGSDDLVGIAAGEIRRDTSLGWDVRISDIVGAPSYPRSGVIDDLFVRK